MKTISRIHSAFGAAWCAFWHEDVYWPVNGTYKCRTCHRVYRVEWANRPDCQQQAREASVSALIAAPSQG
jgi:hypothetical protein